MIRFVQINREIMDDDLAKMLRNNPPDVVETAALKAFLQAAIRIFQKDNEVRNTVLTDAEAAENATCHSCNRASGKACEEALVIWKRWAADER